MTAMKTDDLAVITGPLVFDGDNPRVNLNPGEVVRILEPVDEEGDVWVYGVESGRQQYIAESSAEIHELDDVKWGDLLDPDYVHDYVWEGEN
ncbi:hypothetical protein [Mycobacterium paragordonae]|uniref:Uncharacterized protein n=1 Tax=Mycobacterium paragordonae TaxID=1389713 RepID=A0AAJ1RXL4_9MYCO|nr:hypothetical protein [Mycobacterium paragordonae]MDP7733676.1 hypothetical protein [Mycobacterium paragordonae]